MSTQKPFRIKKSAILSPVAGPTLSIQGEIAFDSSADEIKVRNSASTDSLVQKAAVQTLTNKTLTSPVINSPTGIVKGDVGLGNVDNTSDATKNAAVATLTNKTLTGNIAVNLVSGAATVTLPTTTSTLATLALAETLTNKTLTTPVINSPTGIVKGDVGLGNVDNTSDATKNAAVATLTNKTLTSPVINTPTGIVKGDVGLGNVDNTSDATKNAASVTLTNKTLTAPIMTDPVVSSGPLKMPEQSAPATPASGSVVIYPKTDGNIYKKTSAGIESQIGSGGGGGSKNYLSTVNNVNGNGDFELGATTKWALFNTTLTSLIPTGSITAGAASVTTFDTVSSAQLAGTYSLRTASSAAWSAGQGFISDAFTIDSEDKAKVMTVSGYYNVFANPSNGNFSGTSSNTFAVYIYDTTNSAWIQPAGVYSINQSTGVGFFSATFQTTSNSTQYRVAIIAINASAGAITMYWDDLKISPQTVVYGAPITDWQSYTPTWTADISNPAIGNGTIEGFWRRVGGNIECRIRINSGTTTTYGSVSATGWQFGIPSGLSIDTAKLPSSGTITNGRGMPLGTLAFRYASGSPDTFNGIVHYFSTTTVVGMHSSNAATASANVIYNTVPVTVPASTANNYIGLEFTAPILGWSSTVQMSNDTDTRVVAFSAQASTTVIAASAVDTTVINPTKVYDTHGAYNTSTGVYTVPVSGKYRFSAGVQGASLAYNATANLSLSIVKNGSGGRTIHTDVVDAAVTKRMYLFGSATLDLVAGDTVSLICAQNNAGTSTLTGSTTTNYFEGERISGPSAIAASEKVAAHYRSSTTTSMTSGSQYAMDFNTKMFDTHNAWTTTGAHLTGFAASTGSRFTCPVAGIYRVSFRLRFASITSWNLGEYLELGLFKNGSNEEYAYLYQTMTHTETVSNSFDSLIQCNAGDTLHLEARLSTGGTSGTLDGASGNNFMSIEKIN